MAISNDVFMVGLGIVTYLIIGLTWEFNLTGKAEDRKFNVIKILFTWLLIYIVPLMSQTGLEFAAALGRGADIITLFETFYTVSIYVLIVVSIYFMLFIGYNILLFMGNVTGGKR